MFGRTRRLSNRRTMRPSGTSAVAHRARRSTPPSSASNLRGGRQVYQRAEVRERGLRAVQGREGCERALWGWGHISLVTIAVLPPHAQVWDHDIVRDLLHRPSILLCDARQQEITY